MWTDETGDRYDRSRRRYAGVLAVEEWALVEPGVAWAKRRGSKRTVDVPQVV